MINLSRRELFSRVGRGVMAAAGGASVFAAAPRRKPNFVFILLDDMGWKDLGCYGSRFHETPNIDRLAAEGMRFTNGYAAAPQCSPTRASIMTGKYPARLHITKALPERVQPKPTDKLIGPELEPGLSLDEVTIAEALKAAGYVSGCVGKWHLGPERFYPERQGFDVTIGASHIGMVRSFFYPEWTAPGLGIDGLVGAPRGLEGRPGDYLTDRLTDEALRFMEAQKDAPFFLYLSHYAVHIPINAKKEKIEKYRSKVRPDDPQHSPEYAAMIESVDEGVGRVLRKLEELKIADHTVVFFMSDNGGLDTGSARRPAPTSNLPLRAGKSTLYEGGIREPLIVKWPGVVKVGSACDVPVHSNDFFPTIAEMAGRKLDKRRSVDGISMVPLLTGKGAPNREALYWHFPHSPHPCAAVRRGDYKLIEFFADGRRELYNLAEDLGEKNDLAGKMPEKVAELEKMLHAWQKEVGAQMMTPNPGYNPPR